MMQSVLRYVIITTLLFTTVMASSAAERPRKIQNNSVTKQSGNKVKRNKTLLSALLMMSMNGSHTVPDTDGYLLTEGHTSYGLPFLRTAAMKKNAVEAVYKKYGFNKTVKLKQQIFSTHKWSFQDRLYRSGRYIQTMQEIFEEEDLPTELIFLPLIESQFNPLAYSRASAAGPWQIMPATAKKLNLKMDWWVDERRDPVKSTRAAAQYLKYLYKKFGSWTLALAAYNAGEGRIRKAIRKTGSHDFWTLRKTGYITRETKNYVPSYIAATTIAMNPTDFGFKKITYKKPLKYDEAVIESPMGLELVAALTGVGVRYIKDLNPELKRLCTPPNVPSYTIRIPRGTKKTFLTGLTKTKGYEPYYVRFYTVKKGDTVEKIAMKLGSPVQAIIEMNDLGRRALIKVGKSIIIPLKRNLQWMVSGTGMRVQ